MSAVKVDQSISSSYILSTRGLYQTGYPDGPTSNIEIGKAQLATYEKHNLSEKIIHTPLSFKIQVVY